MFPIDIDFSRLKEVLTYDPQAPMIFSSGIFLWLFAAFMVVYVLLQRKYTARIMFVTLFSYYFYYKSSGTYFFLLAMSFPEHYASRPDVIQPVFYQDDFLTSFL